MRNNIINEKPVLLRKNLNIFNVSVDRYIYIPLDILLLQMIQKYNRYRILELFFDY